MGQFEDFVGINFWTALFVLLNTLAVFFVARKYLFAPVTKIIKQRQDEIDGMYADADKAKTEAEVMQSEYQKQLGEARQTSERMVKEAVARGRSKEDEILRQAKDKADSMLEKAADDISREKQKAMDDIRGEISELAVSIAQKVVEREIDRQDHDAFVDEFIKNVGEHA